MNEQTAKVKMFKTMGRAKQSPIANTASAKPEWLSRERERPTYYNSWMLKPFGRSSFLYLSFAGAGLTASNRTGPRRCRRQLGRSLRAEAFSLEHRRKFLALPPLALVSA